LSLVSRYFVAPSLSAASFLLPLCEMAVTSAEPSCSLDAHMMPMWPRPPTPITPTFMPLRVMARCRGAQVVTPPHMSTAACSDLMDSGILNAHLLLQR